MLDFIIVYLYVNSINAYHINLAYFLLLFQSYFSTNYKHLVVPQLEIMDFYILDSILWD